MRSFSSRDPSLRWDDEDARHIEDRWRLTFGAFSPIWQSYQIGPITRMRLSNLADYAVLMLADAARSDEVRLTATTLAERTGVPLPTAQKLVGRLTASGLLVSSRGFCGGFRLARPAAEISLAEIVEAVEGPIVMTACVEHGRQDCGLDHHCQVRPHWPAVNDAVRGALAGISLASLSVAPAQGVTA